MGWTYTALTEKSEAKLIEITTDDGSLVFVNGTSSSSKTLSVVAEGFTPVSYKWEKKNGDNWTTITGATNSSYTITGVENVGTYRATAYEDANTGYYDIITIASVSDGQGGSSPYLFSLSNENFTINTTNDLEPTTSLNYEVKVTGYHGSSVMTPIASGTPTAEQFKIIIPSGSIFSLKSGTSDTLVYAANTSTALSNENLAETITITYDTNKSETKTITISCAKNGISPTVTQGTGSVTITDASGNTGTVSDGHSPSVTATKDNGVTSVKVDGTQIATISDGATGKNALQPNRNWSSTYTTVNQTTTCGTDDFNRTPVVGDTFTNLDGSSNTGTWQVTAIRRTTVTIKLLSYVNSKGAKGDTGANAIVMTSASTPSGTYNGQVGIWQGQIYIWNGTQWENQTNILPTDAVLHYSFDELPDYPDGAADVRLTDGNTYDLQSTSYYAGNSGGTTFSNVNGNVQAVISSGQSWNGLVIQYTTSKIIKIKIKVSSLVGSLRVLNGLITNFIQMGTITSNGEYTYTALFNQDASSKGFAVLVSNASSSATVEILEIYIGDGSYNTPIIDNANGKWNSVSQSGVAVKGVSGKALYQPSGQAVNINNFNLTDDFTFSIWVNSQSNASNQGGLIFSSDAFSCRNGYPTGNNYLYFSLCSDTGSSEFVTYSSLLPINKFNHLVFVKEGTAVTVYLNGVVIKQQTLSFSKLYPGTSASIGNQWNSRPQSYDDLLIFDRALTEKEVVALYNNKANNPQFYTKADYDLTVRKYQYLGRTLYVPTSNSVTVYTSTTVINGTSASKTAQNGDFVSVMYSGSSGTTPLGKVYKFNGQSWELDSDTGHEIEAMADILMLADSLPSNGTTDLFLSRLTANTAFINKLFAKTITIQHDSSNTGVIQSSNYVADTSGFKMTGDGVAEFNGNSVSINGTKIFATTKEDLIIGKSNFLNSGSSRSGNIFIGKNVGLKHTIGIGNIAMGFGAMENKTKNNGDIAIGYYAMHALTQATGSIAIGNEALGYGSSSTSNIAVGDNAGCVCEGTGNIFIGPYAGSHVTTGNNNIIIGKNITGSSSTTNLVNIGDKIKHESGTLYSANSSGTFKEVLSVTSSSFGSTSGYIKFSNGLMIQWGLITAAGTYSFPIRFDYRPLFVANGRSTADGSIEYDEVPKAISESQYKLNSHYTDVDWLAIGYSS